MHDETYWIDLTFHLCIRIHKMPFEFVDTQLQDAKLVIPQIFGDARWFFMETYHNQYFVQAGIVNSRVQDNHSRSAKGIIRGMHIQTQHTQAKLVRVTRGAIYDVIIDARPTSTTYGKWQWFEINEHNKHALYVPKWFAHGLLTLEDNTEVVYKCDDVYDAMHESGIIRNDPVLNINRSDYLSIHHINNVILSTKDQQNLSRQEFSQTYPHFV